MLFRLLGTFVRRSWALLLALWGVLLLGTWLAAPRWDEVALDREFAFLPATAPSRRAAAVYDKAFPDDKLTSNIVLVLHRPAGEEDRLAKDRTFIDDVIEPALRQIADADGGLATQAAPSDEPLFEGDESQAPAAKAPPPKRSIMARIRTPAPPVSGRYW
jgi:uncharacterized membrane protein YdfJ with MMPL/SSD domain